MKPLRLMPSTLIFVSAAMLMGVITHLCIPFLSEVAGLESIIFWFICGGLGVIARNYLLTNNKYGNLLWFTAVVTSLELEPDPLATYQVCNNCNLCVDLCPSGALTDENNFSQKGCRKVCYITVKGVLELRCWQCRNVCPYKHGIND